MLILLRHGESLWNKKNVFTGWVDVPLSAKGVQESVEAGRKIAHIPIDLVFTSALMRAQMTAALALMESEKTPIFHPDASLQEQVVPIFCDAALNERMYGDLQGMNKAEMAEKFGADQVHRWRRSYSEAPPNGESLQMTIARVLPYFQQEIAPHVEQGKKVLVVAHGNSLRGIAMVLEKLTPEGVIKKEIATGELLFYTFAQGNWKYV